MNILFTNSSDIYAGGEFYVLELARTLQARGHIVHVCCQPENLLVRKCEREGIAVLPLDFPAQGQLYTFVRRLRGLIRKHQIEIVHTNTNYDRTAGAFAARLEGIRHVTNVHSFHSLQHNLTHWIRNRFATDRFLVDGECVQDLLVAADGIPESRISVVRLGVDPERMQRDETQRRAIRSEFSFGEEAVIIGNVARLVPFKGHEYLIRAFADVAKISGQARLLLVGSGELRTPLTSLTESLGVADKVVLAGFRDDLGALYSAFDVYVHPSIEGGGETFPFAVLQALAQELPVVVTRVGDVPVMVDEGRNGFVIPEKNVAAMTEKLSELLEAKFVRRAMGERSRTLLLEQFTLRKMADAVETVYGELRKA